MYLVEDYQGNDKGARLEELLNDGADVESVLGCLTRLALIVDIVGTHYHADKFGHRSGKDHEVDHARSNHDVLRIS